VIAVLFLLIASALWAQPPQYLPACSDSGQLVRHTGYTLHYVESAEQPDWVAYDLTAADVRGTAERADNFRPDRAVPTGSATPADYRKSGYDRGHLAPAADMKWSVTAMDESFFMSNMSPQTPAFNRGIWSRLESKVRDWAVQYGEIRVITGPVLTEGPYATIGTNKVTVPKHYYKVLYDPVRKEGIGYILANEKADALPEPVSIDFVETRTGIDFLTDLPDTLENKVEASPHPSAWK
jgi:endonuclease G